MPEGGSHRGYGPPAPGCPTWHCLRTAARRMRIPLFARLFQLLPRGQSIAFILSLSKHHRPMVGQTDHHLTTWPSSIFKTPVRARAEWEEMRGSLKMGAAVPRDAGLGWVVAPEGIYAESSLSRGAGLEPARGCSRWYVSGREELHRKAPHWPRPACAARSKLPTPGVPLLSLPAALPESAFACTVQQTP